jgi:hypothetical protein
MRGILWLAENPVSFSRTLLHGVGKQAYISGTFFTRSLIRQCSYQVHVAGPFLRTEQSCGCLRPPHLYRTWNFFTIYKATVTECYPEPQFQSKTPHTLPYLFYLYFNFILSFTHTFSKRHFPSRFTERIIVTSPISISAVHILRYRYI